MVDPLPKLADWQAGKLVGKNKWAKCGDSHQNY